MGSAIENKGILQKISIALYKIGLKKSKCIFFQNIQNMNFMRSKGIRTINGRLIPGSGVNINQHNFEAYPPKKETIKILFIGRLMKAKGIEELFDAIKIVKVKYPTVEFHFIGGREENYDSKIATLIKDKLIIYHGRQSNVHQYLKKAHALINPSHHEGMSNVLLEAASTGRPVLASNIPGCKETFDEGVSGLGFTVKDVDGIADTIVSFIELAHEDKIKMGIAGRKKVVDEFDRNIVINTYLEEIQRILEE